MQPVFLGFCNVAKRNGCFVALKAVFSFVSCNGICTFRYWFLKRTFYGKDKCERDNRFLLSKG